MGWTSTVPYIQDAEDGSSAVLDRPLKVLAERTEWLKSRLDELTNKAAVVSQSVRVASTVVVGDLVYFNSATGQYEKALAEWSASFGAEGDLMPSDRAFVKGLVLAVNSSNTADILRMGDWTDAAVRLAVLGASPDKGVYYLSATSPGGVTMDPPPLKSQVLVYEGGDTISFQVMGHPQPNHIHRQYDMAESWLPVTDPEFTDMTIPTDAILGYDVPADSDLSQLFVLYPGSVTLCAKTIVDGTSLVLVDPDLYEVNRYGIWWMSADVDPTDFFDMKLFAYSPLSYDEPVLRAAESITPESLTVQAAQGVLQITQLPFTQNSLVASATAVSSLSGRVQNMTPIVSSLLAGSGAHVANFSNGKAVVSLESLIDAQIDADIYNLNNAVEDSSGDWISVLLPRGRVSTLTGRVPLPKLPTGIDYSVTAFAWVAGSSGQTGVAAKLVLMESPRIAGFKEVAGPSLTTTIPGAGTDSSLVYYREASDDFDMSGDSPSEGSLFLTLTGDGTADVRIIRFGVIVNEVAASGLPDPMAAGLAVRITIPAGYTGSIVQSLVLPESGGASWEYTLRLGSAQRSGFVLGSVAPDGDVSYADDPSTADAGSGSTTEVTFRVDYVATVGDVPGVIRLLCDNTSASPAIITVYGVLLDTTAP